MRRSKRMGPKAWAIRRLAGPMKNRPDIDKLVGEMAEQAAPGAVRRAERKKPLSAVAGWPRSSEE